METRAEWLARVTPVELPLFTGAGPVRPGADVLRGEREYRAITGRRLVDALLARGVRPDAIEVDGELDPGDSPSSATVRLGSLPYLGCGPAVTASISTTGYRDPTYLTVHWSEWSEERGEEDRENAPATVHAAADWMVFLARRLLDQDRARWIAEQEGTASGWPLPGDDAPRDPMAEVRELAALLIDKARVMEVLAEEGRPLSAATLDNYRRRAPEGWPQPVRYVGRTPLWFETAVRDYARRGRATT